MPYDLRYNIRSDVHRSAELLSLCTNPDTDGEAYLDYGSTAQYAHQSHALIRKCMEQHNDNTEANPFLLSVLRFRKPTLKPKKQPKKNPTL